MFTVAMAWKGGPVEGFSASSGSRIIIASQAYWQTDHFTERRILPDGQVRHVEGRVQERIFAARCGRSTAI